MPYRVDRLERATWGGEIGRCLLRKEMGARMSAPAPSVLYDLAQTIWVSFGSTADANGENVHMTVLLLVLDLAQYL